MGGAICRWSEVWSEGYGAVLISYTTLYWKFVAPFHAPTKYCSAVYRRAWLEANKMAGSTKTNIVSVGHHQSSCAWGFGHGNPQEPDRASRRVVENGEFRVLCLS